MLEDDEVYVFDALPYEKKDLEKWIQVVGPANVINLKVEEAEIIKRMRRKA